MPRIVYVNGRYMNYHAAQVHVEDRGFQYSDGVYEVIAVRKGEFVDLEPHLERLERSLSEIQMLPVMSNNGLKVICRELIRRNRVSHGVVYLQITRGVSRRQHAFPPQGVNPTCVGLAWATSCTELEKKAEHGLSVVTCADIRWARRDIKSVSLLPNVLAKQRAADQEADEAWLVQPNGLVNEGSQSNAWIVETDGTLVTPPPSPDILNGITRQRVISLAKDLGYSVVERHFSVEDAKNSREVFVTSTSSEVISVVKIDDVTIGNGVPGSIAHELRIAYRNVTERT